MEDGQKKSCLEALNTETGFKKQEKVHVHKTFSSFQTNELTS